MFEFFTYFFYLIGGGAALAASFAGYMAFLQPDFHFPKPTGRYQVGTITFHLDPSNGMCLQKPRGLMVQLWYPAHISVAEIPHTPYAPYVVDYFKNNHKSVWFALYSRPMYSFAQPNAPLHEETNPFPVIIFSHGLNCTRNHNTAHCENLASHGYVVAGISHSFGCQVVQFPHYLPIAYDPTTEFSSLAANPMNYLKQRHKNIDLWVKDVAMVLNELKQLADEKFSRFYAQLDMNRVGIFGHGYGGAAAAQLCRCDPRIKAGVALDSLLQGKDLAEGFGNRTEGFGKPFMFLLADQCNYDAQISMLKKMDVSERQINEFVQALKQSYLPEINKLARNISHHAYISKVFGTAHMDFSDYALIKEASLASPILHQADSVGPINGRQATTIVNDLLVGFFDEYLKEKEASLATASNYHELNIDMQHFSSGDEITD